MSVHDNEPLSIILLPLEDRISVNKKIIILIMIMAIFTAVKPTDFLLSNIEVSLYGLLVVKSLLLCDTV